MPRTGYTNVPSSKARDRLLEAVCGYLLLDPNEHSSRIQAVDFGLRVAALIIDRGNVERILAELREESE